MRGGRRRGKQKKHLNVVGSDEESDGKKYTRLNCESDGEKKETELHKSDNSDSDKKTSPMWWNSLSKVTSPFRLMKRNTSAPSVMRNSHAKIT